MNGFLALIGLLALLALTIHLVRLVLRDGQGTCAPPRSHIDELGGWAARELRR